MKNIKSLWIQTALVSIILFVTGKLVFTGLFGFFEPQVKGIQFRIRELDSNIMTSTLFAGMLATITVILVLIWALAPVISFKRRVGSVVVVLIFMIAGIILRHSLVKNYFTNVVRPYFLKKGELQVDYPIDPLNFVYYMFTGFCFACVLSFFLFRQRKKV